MIRSIRRERITPSPKDVSSAVEQFLEMATGRLAGRENDEPFPFTRALRLLKEDEVISALLAEIEREAFRSLDAQRDLLRAIQGASHPGIRSLLIYALSSRNLFVDKTAVDRLLASLVLNPDEEIRSAAIAAAIYEINFEPDRQRQRIAFLNSKLIPSDGGSGELRFALAEILIRESEDVAMTTRVLSFLKSDDEVLFKTELARVSRHLPKSVTTIPLDTFLAPTDEEAGYADLNRKLPEAYTQLDLACKLQAAQALVAISSDENARRLLVSLVESARASQDEQTKNFAFEVVTELAHRSGSGYADLVRIQAVELLPEALRVEEWLKLATRGDSSLARATALIRIFEHGNLEEVGLQKLKANPQVNQRLLADLVERRAQKSNN